MLNKPIGWYRREDVLERAYAFGWPYALSYTAEQVARLCPGISDANLETLKGPDGQYCHRPRWQEP